LRQSGQDTLTRRAYSRFLVEEEALGWALPPRWDGRLRAGIERPGCLQQGSDGRDPLEAMEHGKTRFETELQVRPDDLDMNRHVHSSRYSDYVLAARYDQMARCYGMSMEEFIQAGYGWYVRTAHLVYHRPLGLGDRFVVTTWVEAIAGADVRVQFEIRRLPQRKLCCDGYFEYVMVSLATGRAQAVPDWVVDKYRV